MRPVQEGPLPERPLLAPWLRRAKAGATLLLEYGDSIVALEGEAVDRLLPLLDGSHPLEDLEPAQRAAVAMLAAEGVVVPGPAVADEEALREAAAERLAPSLVAERLARSRTVVAGSGVLAEEAHRLLPGKAERVGWESPLGEVDLAVAAPASRELHLLPAWNERMLDAPRPWLLVLPFNGRFGTVGPLFVPGETCCYACFLHRRAAALPDPADFDALQTVPAPYPTGRSLAALLAGAAALVATRWLARREATLAGWFLAIEPAGRLAVTRHRLLRVPRCEACSAAARVPSLLPWASAASR